MPANRRVRGYVLAGGRSMRMGTDKAEVLFRGRTMLATAVRTMEGVCGEVAVVGERGQVPAPARCVPDEFAGCGPTGGIEAALRDCEVQGGEFAVFLPVDTPLLPAGLLRALVDMWTANAAVRVAVTVADGRVQPLISMVHVALLPAFRAALQRGELKLQPLLRTAAAEAAGQMGMAVEAVYLTTEVGFGQGGDVRAGQTTLRWAPTAEEWACRQGWFANLNTPRELQDAAGYLAAEGPDRRVNEGGDGER